MPFTIRRKLDGGWTTKGADDPHGSSVVMTFDLNTFEQDMREKCERQQSICGAVRPSEYISKIEFDDDGNMRIHTEFLSSLGEELLEEKKRLEEELHEYKNEIDS